MGDSGCLGYQKDIDSPTLDNILSDSIWKSQINMAHAHGLKVFFKPHVWLSNPSNGKWRSDIFPANEADWQQWQKNYREFILFYAKMAQDYQVELFCVGMELSRLSVEKPVFWQTLIKDVRSVYDGKITYAANWYEEFEKVTFWDELDYIGIQAYFPLVGKSYPSVEEVSEGWNQYLPIFESIHKKYQRKILFTEMGYKSTPDSAVRPWEWIEHTDTKDIPVSLETQANCYEAFFKTLWSKEWFTGVHIWQWRSEYLTTGGKNNLDFTPQRKPAEKVIQHGFSNHLF